MSRKKAFIRQCTICGEWFYTDDPLETLCKNDKRDLKKIEKGSFESQTGKTGMKNNVKTLVDRILEDDDVVDSPPMGGAEDIGSEDLCPDGGEDLSMNRFVEITRTALSNETARAAVQSELGLEDEEVEDILASAEQYAQSGDEPGDEPSDEAPPSEEEPPFDEAEPPVDGDEGGK